MKISFNCTIDSWKGQWSWGCSLLPAVIVSKYYNGADVLIGWLLWSVDIIWEKD